MKPSARISRAVLCLSLLVGNSTMLVPVLAVEQSANAQLDKFESTVFGATHKNENANQRLSALEKNLFGKARPNLPPAQRMQAISKALLTGNLLSPPLAAQMDNSAPARQPENTSSTWEPQAETAKAAPELSSAEVQADRAKETLKRAIGLYSQGNTPGAEQAFRQVLSIDNKNADAYYNLGVIAEGKGDLKGALDNYRWAANLRPSDGDLATAVSSVQEKLAANRQAEEQAQKQQAQAAQEAKQEQLLTSLKPLTDDASTAFKSGNFDKAINDLQQVARQAPQDSDVQYALAQAYRGKGQTSQARQALNRAIELEPDNQLYRLAMSQLSSQSGQGGEQDGLPPTAPDYARALSAPTGQLTGFDRANDNGYQQVGSTSDNSQAGTLTPFSSQGMNNLSGYQQGFANRLGYSGYPGYQKSTGTRLSRAALGATMGMASGMIFGSMMAPPGYRSSAAMRGGLTGGLMGLIMGGLH